ncbi:phage holin family protein [Kibdelosporangium philippinense]|uniref:Phage holin family protein n=1 Tax=Kibdelosporangium philippinense TaxID=211113 RepID=A0ABS8ZWY5_9PSEU|nr:phage holin family protein [Kibdelosporangium philippinense]MCE7010908.1 phage holin family protein [Kibdelosporangium philippinense]
MIEEVNKTPAQDKSVGQLVTDLSDGLKRLVRDEIRLAVFELRHKGKKAGVGAGLFGAAGLFAVLGLATLVAAVVLALALVMAAWLSAVLVAAALLIVAGIAALIGKSQISRATPPVPAEAIDSIREDVRTIQQGVRS